VRVVEKNLPADPRTGDQTGRSQLIPQAAGSPLGGSRSANREHVGYRATPRAPEFELTSQRTSGRAECTNSGREERTKSDPPTLLR
jgi:hypothetical protein